MRQEIGGDALAAVLDREVHGLGGAPHGDRDDPRLEAELGGVADQVGERLRQPAGVAADVQLLVRHVDLEAVPAGVELVVAARHRRLDDAVDRHRLAHQRDLALGGTGDVDQLLHQPAEAADLTLEDLAQADQDRVAVLEGAQHAGHVGDRRQGIAQLVRQHRQELALAPLGQAQRLGPLGQRLLEHLALVDVDRAADEAGRGAVGAAQDRAVVDEPAVLAVVPAQPQVEGERGFAPRSWWRGCRGSARGPRGGRSGSSPRPATRSTPARCRWPRTGSAIRCPADGKRSRRAPAPRRRSPRSALRPVRAAEVLLGGWVSRFLRRRRVLLLSRQAAAYRLTGNRRAAATGAAAGREASAGCRIAVPRRGAGARPKAASAAGGTW